MRYFIIVFLTFISIGSLYGQDSIHRWKYGVIVDLYKSYKIKSDYVFENYGTDLVRNMNNSGWGGGFKFVAEFKEKWGFGFKASLTDFNFNIERIDEKMLDRLGEGFLGISNFSLYGNNTTSHGLRMLELISTVHRVFFATSTYNFLVDGGFQYSSCLNPEYSYIYRTPSTNYYEKIDVLSKRSGLKPMVSFGFSVRKSMVYEGNPDENRKGYIGLRLGTVYGFSYFDYYIIKTENHLNEITEIRMDVPVSIWYFNLGLSVAFM